MEITLTKRYRVRTAVMTTKIDLFSQEFLDAWMNSHGADVAALGSLGIADEKFMHLSDHANQWWGRDALQEVEGEEVALT